jgi:PAS domain S-box-containing protein
MAQRLRESEAWRSSLLRSIGDAVIAAGPDGVKFLNPLAETLTGWKEELAIGRPLDEVFKPLRVPERRAGGWTDAAYTSLVARDGSERPIEADDTPIRDVTGAIWGTVWTFRDISRRKWLQDQNAQLYAEARRAIQTREDVLAVVSHDLRSPLASISLTAEQLIRNPGKVSPQRASEKLETILCCARRMARLIRDLLDVARIDGGRLTLELERAAPGDLVKDVVAMFEVEASERSIRIVRTEIPGPAVAVLCDRDRALQVLANLLSNAVKFTRERGSIVLGAQQRGPVVQFSITDDGPGLGPEQLPHLFERYWQAPETARRGSGLGLYIARGIVEAHRGRIWVDSAPGMGSTFHFTLPVAGQEEEQAVAPV